MFRVGDAASHCLPFTGEGIRPALYFGLACGQIVRQVLDDERHLAEGLAVYRRFVASHRWVWPILWSVQALFSRLPPTVLALPAGLLTRPRVLHPTMWDYYQLFDPAALANLRSYREPVDQRARPQDQRPVHFGRAGGDA